MCDKNIKRLVALLLAFCIVWMQIVRDTTTVKAVGAVATASALWEALTAASGAYAGYSLTNKQNKTVTQQLASYLSDFADTLIDAPYEHLSSVSDFTIWMVSEIVPKNGLLTKDSAYLLTKAFCEQAGNTVDGIKKHAVVLEKNVKKIETAKPTNPKDDDDGGLLPALLKEIALNIAADGAINAGKKFIKFCGTLTDLIIKDNLNAEYIKGKGKWDWASLGFKTDYDTVTISSSDGSKFKGINDGCGAAVSSFDYHDTLLQIDDGTYRHVVHLGAGAEKTAIVTAHNPDNDKWMTCIYPEDVVYRQMVEFKAGNITCDEFFEWMHDNYYSSFDTASKNSGDFFELLKDDRRWYQGVVFDGFLWPNTYYGSPLHIQMRDKGGGDYAQFFLNKLNTTVYNLGVTANIFYINFTSDTKYTGATTALNGTETMQPTVKPSKYTNTAEQVDKQSDTITINNYVINNYSNTDNVINNIANDNDLTLDSKDNDDSGTSSDYTSLLKSILSTLKNVPKNTYKYFNNKLDMIITAIQSGNSEDVVNVITQLNNPMDRMINQLNNIDNTLFDFKSTGLSLKNVSVDLDVNNFALSIATEINTVLVNVFVPGDDYFDTKFTVINNQLKNKLGYDGYVQLMDDIKEIKEAKPSNIVINTSNLLGGSNKVDPQSSDLAEASGDSTVVVPDVPPDESDGKSKITLVNFNTYYKYKDTIDAWVRGFVFIALLIFNIRHVYLNVRGHDIGVNTVDIKNL